MCGGPMCGGGMCGGGVCGGGVCGGGVRCGGTQVDASRRGAGGVWSDACAVQDTQEARHGGGPTSQRRGSEEGRCGWVWSHAGCAHLQRRDEKEVEVGHLGEDVVLDELGEEVVERQRHPEHPADREEDVLCRFLRRRRRRAVSGVSDGCRISIIRASPRYSQNVAAVRGLYRAHVLYVARMLRPRCAEQAAGLGAPWSCRRRTCGSGAPAD
jgi:hypothetical protein